MAGGFGDGARDGAVVVIGGGGLTSPSEHAAVVLAKPRATERGGLASIEGEAGR